MKESLTPAKDNNPPASLQKNVEPQAEVKTQVQTEPKPEVKAEVTKKSNVNNRKTSSSSIRAKIAAAAAARAKDSNPSKDPFNVEFAFDVSEDPFKPKKALGSSPTRISPTPPVAVRMSHLLIFHLDLLGFLWIPGMHYFLGGLVLSRFLSGPSGFRRISFGFLLIFFGVAFQISWRMLEDPFEGDYVTRHTEFNRIFCLGGRESIQRPDEHNSRRKIDKGSQQSESFRPEGSTPNRYLIPHNHSKLACRLILKNPSSCDVDSSRGFLRDPLRNNDAAQI